MFRRCLRTIAAPSGRRGLTLIELVIAMTILIMVMGTLEMLAQAVHQAFEHNAGQGTAVQHARVVLDRITRTANEATANEQFPGFLVLADTVSGWRFPDTLVVWHPSGQPADASGLPRYNELVIYCPSSYIPNQLLEITVPGDTRTVPPVSDLTTWANEIAAIKKNQASTTVVLTDLLRSCVVSSSGGGSGRGAVRFETRLLPSDSEWSQYKAGTLAWNKLSWVQGTYGSQTGLRQSWLRLEVQIMPGTGIVAEDAADQQPLPFFGSAAVYYGVHQ